MQPSYSNLVKKWSAGVFAPPLNRVNEYYQLFNLNLDFVGAWFLGPSWICHPDACYFCHSKSLLIRRNYMFMQIDYFQRFISSKIDTCCIKWILVTGIKFLPQEKNCCHRNLILVTRNKCLSREINVFLQEELFLWP